MLSLLAQTCIAAQPSTTSLGFDFGEPLSLVEESQLSGKPSIAPVFYGDPHPDEQDFPHQGLSADAMGRDSGRFDGGQGKDDKKWPDISQPGPDMGDFPNSAYTLPKGGAQIEVSPATIAGRDASSPGAFAAPYLLRYGVTDNVEFRIFGNGFTRVDNTSQLSGFAPPKLDMKVHLWDDCKQWFIPAASLEVYVTTTWGTPAFSSAWEPSLNLNFDLPVTEKLNFEWTVGYSGVQQVVNINTGERLVPKFNYVVPGVHRQLDATFNQVSVQYAIEYQLTDRLAVFFDGFHNGALHVDLGSGDMIGQGVFYELNDRLLGFGSVSEGVTPNVPNTLGQIGFALAL